MTMTTQDACRSVLEKVDECLAVGVVDLGTGMLMGVHHTVPYFTQSYLDAVAATAVDLFQGRNIRRIEELLSAQRGAPVQNSFEEVFISSQKTFHFMAVIREKDAVVVMVTRKGANQGMGWAALRSSIDAIRGTLP